MIKNVLIYRTDRIGDLIVSCPSIITIKKSIENSKITLITSHKNHNYAKNFNIFDEIIEYPKKNIFKKISFILKLRKKKYDYIFVFDGKERSILSASLCKSSYKIALTSKEKFYYKFFKIAFFEDTEKTDIDSVYQKMIYHAQIDNEIGSYDFLSKKKDNNFSKNIPIKDYLHIHLDEKWFSELYISTYTNINPSYDDFEDFLNTLSYKYDLLITTGLKDLNLIDDLKKKYFEKVTDKIFLKKSFGKLIYLIYKPYYEDIESLLRTSKVLLSCHGSVLHAANSFNIKKFDIIEKGMESFYKRYTTYLSEYSSLYRVDFKELKRKLLIEFKI